MPLGIRLVSINVEGVQHLDTVLPFLSREMPDVACVQEVCEENIEEFCEALGGASCFFAPMIRQTRNGATHMSGIGIFSKLPVVDRNIHYYNGDTTILPETDFDKPETFNKANRAIMMCDVEKEGTIFKIANTHFTWTPRGEADHLQRRDIQALFNILDTSGEFVLTGDFNAPRGGEIFSILAEKYKDNVPAHYTTSIDQKYHRAGKLEYMVDGIFSTPGYRVAEVEMVCGLSDHCALKCFVSRA